MNSKVLGPKKCPKCRLVNEPGAVTCDCGFNFETKSMQAPRSVDRTQRPVDTLEAQLVLEVAEGYRALVGIIGLQMLCFAGSRGLNVGTQSSNNNVLAILGVVATVAALALAILAAVKGYRLADAMQSSAPWAWAIGFFVPCVSLFVLLALSARATDFCRRYGLRVGLLGPTRDSIEEFAGRHRRR